MSTTDQDSIHKICARGDRSSLIKLVKKEGKSILSLKDDEYGQSPLHVSAENGKEEIVQYLLQDKYQNKVEVNAVDKNGWTPLHSACKSGHLDIIELLLNKGAFCRAVTNEGASPLHYFVRNECKDPLKFHKTISALCRKAAAVDTENKHGETALHQAAMRGRLQNILYLLNNKADPNYRTRHGETSLYFAARGNHIETMDTLLQMGANPTLEASKEIGSLYSVVKKFESEELQRLLYLWYVNNKVSLPPEMEQDLEHLQNLVKNHPPPSSTSSTSSSIPNSSSSSNLAYSSPSLSSSHSHVPTHHRDSSFDRLTSSHPLPIPHSNSIPISPGDADDPSDKNNKKNNKKKDRVKKQQMPKSPKVSQREIDGLGKSPKSSLLTEEMMQRNTLFKERQRSQSVCTELPYPAAVNNGNYTQRIENLTKRTQALREGADLPPISPNQQHIEQAGTITSVKDAIASIEQKSLSPAPKGMMDRINQLKQNAASSINVHAIEDSVGYYSSSAPASPAVSNSSDRSSDAPPSSSPVSSSMLQKRNSKNDPLARKNSGHKSNPSSGEYEPLPKTFSNSKLDINLLKKDDLISKFKSGWHCKICSKIHTEVPLFLCCAFPHDYEELAPQEKEVRSKISSDLCSIDNIRFFVRGLLEIPILSNPATPDSKSGSSGGSSGGKNQPTKPPMLTFIPWILVETSDFFKIMEKWKDNDSFSINGVLNNNLPVYGDTIGTLVTLTIRQNGLRPIITLSQPDKAPAALAKDISDGINVSRLETIFETLLHGRSD